MAKVKLDIGATIDTLSKSELDDSLAKYRQQADAYSQGAMRGFKYIRMGRLYATPTTGTVVIGTGYPNMAPDSGYVWSVRRLSATGLGTGNAPDILNIYRNETNTDPVWQLNGNNWCYTFGKSEFLLLSGEFLMAKSLGSMTSTSQITLSADVVEVPAEMIGKLIV